MKITRFDDLYGETLETGVTLGSSVLEVAVPPGIPPAVPSPYPVPTPPVVTTGFETTTKGGGSVVKVHGTTGATETYNPADGNIHTATLGANCTITLTGPASGPGCTIELRLTQDGAGSRLVTWPGSVVWAGGAAPTLATAPASIDFILLETIDGGTTWYGFHPGGGSSLGTATPTDHQHIDNVMFSGDGSTAAFELPAAPFDAFSVAAYVAGARVGQSLSGTMLTTLTFDTAPASGTNNIVVDIAAAVA